jgi:LppX_LprAFG lipoprotein
MRILGAIAVVLALAVAGCGGNGKQAGQKPVSGALIVAAASKSTRAGSVEADFQISGPGVKGSGSGVFNTGPSRSAQLSLKVNVRGMTVPIDSVISGNALYMRSSAFSQLGLPPGKQWVKLDLGQLAQQRGIDLSSLANTSPTPASALSYLRGSSKVEQVGSESVDGVDATHYKVTVDLERAAARSSGSDRESLKRVIRASGVKTLPIDVWVDGKGYVRKVQYAQRIGSGKAVKITMTLHDFGSPVSVKPPPADSVVDLAKALGQ